MASISTQGLRVCAAQLHDGAFSPTALPMAPPSLTLDRIGRLWAYVHTLRTDLENGNLHSGRAIGRLRDAQGRQAHVILDAYAALYGDNPAGLFLRGRLTPAEFLIAEVAGHPAADADAIWSVARLLDDKMPVHGPPFPVWEIARDVHAVCTGRLWLDPETADALLRDLDPLRRSVVALLCRALDPPVVLPGVAIAPYGDGASHSPPALRRYAPASNTMPTAAMREWFVRRGGDAGGPRWLRPPEGRPDRGPVRRPRGDADPQPAPVSPGPRPVAGGGTARIEPPFQIVRLDTAATGLGTGHPQDAWNARPASGGGRGDLTGGGPLVRNSVEGGTPYEQPAIPAAGQAGTGDTHDGDAEPAPASPRGTNRAPIGWVVPSDTYEIDMPGRRILRNGVECLTKGSREGAPLGRSEFQAAVVLFRHLGTVVPASALAERLGIALASLKPVLSGLRAALGLGGPEDIYCNRYLLMPEPGAGRGMKSGVGLFDAAIEFGFLDSDPAQDPAHITRLATGRPGAPAWVLNHALAVMLRPNERPVRLEQRVYDVGRFYLERLGRYVPTAQLTAALKMGATTVRTYTTRFNALVLRPAAEGKSALLDEQAAFVMKFDKDRGVGVFCQAHELGLAQGMPEHYEDDVLTGPGFLLNARGGTRQPGGIVNINGITQIIGPTGFLSLRRLLETLDTPVALEVLAQAADATLGTTENALRDLRRTFFPTVGSAPEVRYALQPREGGYAIRDAGGWQDAVAHAEAPPMAEPATLTLGEMSFDQATRTLARPGSETVLLPADVPLLMWLWEHIGEYLPPDEWRRLLGLEADAPGTALTDAAYRIRMAMGLPRANRWTETQPPPYLLTFYPSMGGGLFDVRDEMALLDRRRTVPDPAHIVRVRPHSSFGARELVMNAHLWAVMEEDAPPQWLEPGYFRLMRLVMMRVDHTVSLRQLMRASGLALDTLQSRMRELRAMGPFREGLFDLQSERGVGYRAARVRRSLYPTARQFEATLPAGVTLEEVLSVIPPRETAALLELWKLTPGMQPLRHRPDGVDQAGTKHPQYAADAAQRLPSGIAIVQALHRAGEKIVPYSTTLRLMQTTRVAQYVGSATLARMLYNWFGMTEGQAPTTLTAELRPYGIYAGRHSAAFRDILWRLARGSRRSSAGEQPEPDVVSVARPALPTVEADTVPAYRRGLQAKDMAAVAAVALRKVPALPSAERRAEMESRAIGWLKQDHGITWPDNASLSQALCRLAPDQECMARAALGLWPYARRFDNERLGRDFGLPADDVPVLTEFALAELAAHARLLSGMLMPERDPPMPLERVGELLQTRGYALDADEVLLVLTWRGLGRTARTRLVVRDSTRLQTGTADEHTARRYRAAIGRLTGMQETKDATILRRRAQPYWPPEQIKSLYYMMDAGLAARVRLGLAFHTGLEQELGSADYGKLLRYLGLEQERESLAKRDIPDEVFAALVIQTAAAAKKRADHRARIEQDLRGHTKTTTYTSAVFARSVLAHRAPDPTLESYEGRALELDAVRANARRLTMADIRDLLTVADEGQRAFGELEMGNTRLAVALANRRGKDERLVEYALIGLRRALIGWDPRMALLSSYAKPTIESQIFQLSALWLSERFGIPSYRAQELIMTRVHRNRLRATLAQRATVNEGQPANEARREPTLEEIAGEVYESDLRSRLRSQTPGREPSAQEWIDGWDRYMPQYLEQIEKFLPLIAEWERMEHMGSMDAPRGETERTRHETVAAASATEEERMMQPGVSTLNLVAAHLLGALDEADLDDPEEYVLLRTFGIAEYEEMTPDEIAGVLDVDVSEVRTMLTSALIKVQGSSAAMQALARYRNAKRNADDDQTPA
jgi:hypothetical protein